MYNTLGKWLTDDFETYLWVCGASFDLQKNNNDKDKCCQIVGKSALRHLHKCYHYEFIWFSAPPISVTTESKVNGIFRNLNLEMMDWNFAHKNALTDFNLLLASLLKATFVTHSLPSRVNFTHTLSRKAQSANVHVEKFQFNFTNKIMPYSTRTLKIYAKRLCQKDNVHLLAKTHRLSLKCWWNWYLVFFRHKTVAVATWSHSNDQLKLEGHSNETLF